jgi:hypothetical protein
LLTYFWRVYTKYPYRKATFLTTRGDGIAIIDFAYLATQFSPSTRQGCSRFVEPSADAKDSDREYRNPQHTAAFSAFRATQLTAQELL